MAGRGDRTLTLNVVADTKDIKKDVAEVNKNLGSIKKTTKAVAVGFAGAFAVDTVIDFASGAIDAASDLNESISKVGVVFGESADAIDRWSDDAARSMGLSKQSALEAAGTFGNLFDALGLADQAQRDMSKGAVQLASDLASFNNADVEETLQAIQSGLLGEAEPMRRFGSNLSEARVQAYALAKGWVRNKSALTDQQKVQARYNLILEDTVNAQGDFARTSDGVANKARIQQATTADLTAEFGQMLIPLRDIALDAGMAAIDTIKGLGEAFHDLERFMSPHLAAIEDQRDELYEYAEQVGADVDSLRAWIDAQDAARKAVADHEASIEGLHEQARIFADQYNQLQGYLEDGVLSTDEAADSSRYVTEQMRGLGYVVDEASGNWVRYEESTTGAAEKTAELARQISLFRQSAQSQARLAPLARRTAQTIATVYTTAATNFKAAGKEFKAAVPQFDQGTDALVADLKGTKADVRTAMAGIKDALLHPFRTDDLEKTYRSAIKRGTAAMNRALKSGNEEAYARAAQFVKDYKAKLRELRQQTFRVRVSMFVTDSGATGPGAVLLGGAAGAGWGTSRGRNPRKPKRKGHATGTAGSPGGWRWVGEQGPELMNIAPATRIIDHRASMASAAGSPTYVNVNVNAPVGSSPADIGRELKRYLTEYERRGG